MPRLAKLAWHEDRSDAQHEAGLDDRSSMVSIHLHCLSLLARTRAGVASARLHRLCLLILVLEMVCTVDKDGFDCPVVNAQDVSSHHQWDQFALPFAKV